MTCDKQVKLWVEGKSIHKGNKDDKGSKCCPDFSCCRPEFQASREEREKYAAAHFGGDEESRMGMLMGFLGRAMRIEYGEKVHVAGEKQEPDKQ